LPSSCSKKRVKNGSVLMKTGHADSDEIGHLFQEYSDTLPGYSDSCRSEATLGTDS
jgi:hypothetical protein